MEDGGTARAVSHAQVTNNGRLQDTAADSKIGSERLACSRTASRAGDDFQCGSGTAPPLNLQPRSRRLPTLNQYCRR